MKTMSIIGIVWFALSFMFLLIFLEDDIEAAAGWGILGLLYALPYSIVGLVKSKSKKDTAEEMLEKLETLKKLKEGGMLSEEQFEVKKAVLLNENI